MEPVSFFLGANSGEGFFSLYDQLLSGRFYDLLILKGSPGSGKSTFMRHIAKRLNEAGVQTILIRCSGDPDSLDGVIVPELRCAVVDGTAPHALEPTYTLAHERYVDLTRFCDVAGAKDAQSTIRALSDAYRAHYGDAYHILRARCAVESERRRMLTTDHAALLRRAEGVAARELKGSAAAPGRAAEVFLGGMTCQGAVCRYESVMVLCPRVYELVDSAGAGAAMLSLWRDAAVRAGIDAIVCRNPDRPQELQHLLLPSRGVAFVTSNERWRYPAKPTRRLRLDAMAETKLSRAEKARVRFVRRIERELSDEAVAALRRAKEAHDALEAVYHPFVDFTGVLALAEQEAERLLSYRAVLEK